MQITRAQPSAATAAFASEVGHQDPVAVEGGRTHWQHGGSLAAHARLLRAPTGVVSFEPQEMIVRCGAGTTVAEVADVLAAKAQMCTLDPGDPHRSTVGGVLAAGVSGHRRLRHGPVRDLLLEAQYVAADGTIIRAGAPVVKNVSGFDLNKLLVGSFGSLGLLAEVVLRCRPVPAVSGWFRLEGADPWRVRACVHDPSSILWDGALVWVLVEGDAGDVAAECRSLGALGDVTAVACGPDLPAGGRLSIPAADVRACGGAEGPTAGLGPWVAEIGVGTVHVTHTPPLVALPNAALQHQLKRAYDPTGRLSPGRFPW